MTLRRDKIKDHIDNLSNDEKKWNAFTLQQVAQAAHNAVEPEIKELEATIKRLSEDADGALKERVHKLEEEAAANEKEHADIKAKADAINVAIVTFIEAVGAAENLEEVSDAAHAFADALKDHDTGLHDIARNAATSLE